MGRGGEKWKGSARTIKHAVLDDQAVDQPVRPAASGSSFRDVRSGAVGRESDVYGEGTRRGAGLRRRSRGDYRCGPLGAGECSRQRLAKFRSRGKAPPLRKEHGRTGGANYWAASVVAGQPPVGAGSENGTDDSGGHGKKLQRAGSPGPGLGGAHQSGDEPVAPGARHSGGNLTRKHAEGLVARVCCTETEWCGPVERATGSLARTCCQRFPSETSGMATLLLTSVPSDRRVHCGTGGGLVKVFKSTDALVLFLGLNHATVSEPNGYGA